MEFGAEFFVLLAFLVFVCLLIYLGAHRRVVHALDERGKAIADELSQAAKLRAEAKALLASFAKKQAEAEAQAAQIVAEARVQAQQLAKDAEARVERIHRPPHPPGRTKDRLRRDPVGRCGAGRCGRSRGARGRDRAARGSAGRGRRRHRR